ncbi:MAG: hypothetical protein GF403_01800 [Candidatus Coatesbacteria bacterium]|nr:hypothetical protein [Candidatus Coatesbacteria bacterium]
MSDFWPKLLGQLRRTLPYIVRLVPLLERHATDDNDGREAALALIVEELAESRRRLRLLLVLDAAALTLAALAWRIPGAMIPAWLAPSVAALGAAALLASLVLVLAGLLAEAAPPGEGAEPLGGVLDQVDRQRRRFKAALPLWTVGLLLTLIAMIIA